MIGNDTAATPPAAAPQAPAPAVLAPLTTPPPATPTTVTVTEKNRTQVTVDLHHMSKEDSDKLYDALGQTGTATDYQQLANQIASFAQNFKSIISIDLPEGMSWQYAMNNFMKALNDNGGTIKDGSDPYLKALEASPAGQSIIQNGMWKSAAATAAAASTMGEFTSNLFKPISTAGALFSATTGITKDALDQLGGGMNEEEAKAMGTAYAAALYSKVDAPGVQHDPNFLDKGTAWVESHFTSIWNMLPPSIPAFFKAIGKYFSSDVKNWDSAYAAALTEVAADRAAPELDYHQTLQRNLAEAADKSSRPEAADMLRQAETVAGTSTAPIADIVEKGGIYRDKSGTYNTLTFDHGQPKTDTVKDAEGKPLTRAHRNNDKLHAVVETLPHSAPAATGYASGVGIISALEYSRIAPLRRMWNLGTELTFGIAKVGSDAVLGGTSGVTSFVTWPVRKFLPANSPAVRAATELEAKASKAAGMLGKEVDERVSLVRQWAREDAAIDAAGRAAAELAAKEGTAKLHLTGDALKNMVENARDLARTAAREKAAAGTLVKPGGALMERIHTAVDWVHTINANKTTGLENASLWVRKTVDGVKKHVKFDLTTMAQKQRLADEASARVAVEAAKGELTDATINAAKAAHAETVGGKATALFEKATTFVKIRAPHWMGGGAGVKTAEEGAEVAAKAAPEVGLLFRGARFAGKAIPFLAVAWILGEEALGSSAHAETVDGHKLVYAEQLRKDYIVGRISHKQYEVYKNLQDHYCLTGVGGAITAGVLEVGQDSLSQLDKASVVRYLPASILDTIRTSTGHQLPDSAPQGAPNTAAERRERINIVKQEMLDHEKPSITSAVLGPMGGMRGMLDISVNMDRVLQSVGTVPVAPPAAAPAKPEALTSAELQVSHAGIIDRARREMGLMASEFEKLTSFNLGMKGHSVTVAMGSTVTPGSNGSAQPAAKQLQQVSA